MPWAGNVWVCAQSITMVATHLPQKACDAHVISFTRPSSRLTNFFPASKIVIAEESEREGMGTRLVPCRENCDLIFYCVVLIILVCFCEIRTYCIKSHYISLLEECQITSQYTFSLSIIYSLLWLYITGSVTLSNLQGY